MAQILGRLAVNSQDPLVGQVTSVYTFVYRSLIAAHSERDPRKLDDALAVLGVERETWRQVCTQRRGFAAYLLQPDQGTRNRSGRRRRVVRSLIAYPRTSGDWLISRCPGSKMCLSPLPGRIADRPCASRCPKPVTDSLFRAAHFVVAAAFVVFQVDQPLGS